MPGSHTLDRLGDPERSATAAAVRTGSSPRRRSCRERLSASVSSAWVRRRRSATSPRSRSIEGVELVALCDRDPEKAARVAQKFGIPHAVGRIDDTARRRRRSTRSTSARPTSCTRRWRSPRSRPASTCCASGRSRAAPTRRAQMVKAAKKADRAADVRGAAPLPRRRAAAAHVRRQGRPGRRSSTPRPAGCGSAPSGTPTSGASRSASPAAAWCSTSASRCSTCRCGCWAARRSSR